MTVAERPERRGREPIAVVGIGCRLPGGAGGPDALWRLLCEGFDAIGPFPSERFDADALFDPRSGVPGRIATRWSGSLPDVDQFDASFFEIAPREAERLDPQQRLLLETAWEALEDAGLPRERFAGTNGGVFVGLWLNEFEARAFADENAIDLYSTTGTGRYAASGRLSFFLDLRGPSVTIDSACSSSLVAVHLACQSLRNDECELALAGGANVILEPSITLAYSQSGMMAVDGRCKFGDRAADGYVRSDGAAVVVLKRLSSALADGDPIRAVVLGSAVTNDGRSGGFLATPGQAGQEAMLRRAYADAGVDPRTVQYIEAHGTGTATGDPVELRALGAVVGAARQTGHPCLIGSLKSNVGHTEGAAGVAGLVKAVLALERGAVPASLHVREPNPDVPWDDLGLELCREHRSWPDHAGPRRAGVSSFGITGTNAHVVLEAPPALPTPHEDARRPLVLAVSAHSPAARRDLAGRFASLLHDTSDEALADVCGAAALGRTHHRHRVAVVGDNSVDLATRLAARVEDTGSGRRPEGAPRVVFVFPGQGSQWPGMARELLATEAHFAGALARCDAAIRSEAGWSPLEVLRSDAGAAHLGEIDVVQPTLFSVQVALAAQWRAWGIEPDAVVGHSMGEIAAAHVAGALTLPDAVAVICRRSRLLRRVAGHGAMAVLDLGVDEVEAALRGRYDRVSVAVSNGPRSTVISGDPAAVEEILTELEGRDVFCRRVKVDVASHSPQMDPLLDELETQVRGVAPQRTDVAMYSTVDGRAVDGRELDARYWRRNLRLAVRFGDAVARAAAEGGDAFIELSPHPILVPAVDEVLRLSGFDTIALASLRRGSAERQTMLTTLAALYERGAAIAWPEVLGPPARRVRLPAYPWQRQRYWFEPPRRQAARASARSLWGACVRPAADPGTAHWETSLASESLAFLRDHVVRGAAVMPAAGFVDLMLGAAAELTGDAAPRVDELALDDLLTLDSVPDAVLQLTLERRQGQPTRARVFSVESPGGEGRLHATATISTTAPISRPLLIDAVRDRCPEHRTHDEHDASMRARGLSYGPAFRTVEECWVGRSEALGRLAATSLDPAARRIELLDGALQVALAALPPATPAGTYLPVRIRSVHQAAPVTGGGVWAHAVVTEVGENGARGDVTICDNTGAVLAEVHGLQLRRAGSSFDHLADLLYDVSWQPAEREPRRQEGGDPGTWIVYAVGAVGRDVAARLVAAGNDCLVVTPGRSTAPVSGCGLRIEPSAVADHAAVLREAVRRAAGAGVGIVYAWAAAFGADDTDVTSAAEEAEEMGCRGPIALLQALDSLEDDTSGLPPLRLWLVTAGAQAAEATTTTPRAVAASQAVLWGLGRVVAAERPTLHSTLVDLDPRRTDEAALFAEVTNGSADQQVALRGDERLVPRLEAMAIPSGERRQQHPTDSFRLYAATPGSLDELRLRAEPRRPPGAGEVEVRIDAAGLNFLDVLKAMAICPGVEPSPEAALGAEGAGVVVSVGPRVRHLAVGDEVVVLTPSYSATSLFASYATVPAPFVVPRPENLTAVTAGALPVAYLTAYYALHELARVRAGERVLIHSAAGGVGRAALSVCRAIGADVIATAGDEARRRELRAVGVAHVFDSRSLDFAAEVRACTGGRGVDVVLNALAGDAIPAGLTTLAPRGRFVEIGKRDVYANARLELRPFADNISFFVVDLARLTEQDPTYVAEMFATVMAMVARQQLDPLPVTAAPITAAGDVFRSMAQARHHGKLALTIPHGAVPADVPCVRADATYLITGGWGALGLAVARRLVHRGARHLVLLGRSAPSAAAAAMIDGLRRPDVEVRVIVADVTDGAAVDTALAAIRLAMPPLHGIVHAAGALADATVNELDDARLHAALAPKLAGGGNVHRATLDDPLDFFVLFSSVAATLGLAGQANYAAANAFLDALAHQRVRAGRPATSIAWGPWAEIGLAATASRGERLASQGLGSIAETEALDALELILEHGRSHATVMRFDASAWLASEPAAAVLVRDLGPTVERSERPSMWPQRLLGLTAGARRESLEHDLCEEIAAVLRVPAEHIDRRLPLKAMGLDSLMALELRNRLERTTGLSLAAAVVWNHPTVVVLAEHLAGRMGIGLGATEPMADATSTSSSDLPPEATATQAELEALLDEELAAVQRLLDAEGPSA
jgi:acyl transferase domain-containing protein